MKNKLQAIGLVVDQFIDACRRLFIVAERWDSKFTHVPIEGVDWHQIRELERSEIVAALKAVESFVERLGKVGAGESVLPESPATILKSATKIADHACRGAREQGWFDGKFGTVVGWYIIHELRYSVALLGHVADVMLVSRMLPAEREVLEVLLENSPLIGDDLVSRCKFVVSQDGQFREMLASLVEDNLLIAGRGRYSAGYRLTDRGIQLAQMSRQLQDF